MTFEPRPLTEDTLVDLLNEGTERPGLDYKSRCDLTDTRDKVAITKDVGAMMIQGGYLVIGADDNGKPTGAVTEKAARLFDQATLQSKLQRYLADGFDVRSAALELDGNWFGLICVRPHPEGFAPMKADGNYTDPSGQARKEFSAGDVFARHGTKSERWVSEDVRTIRVELRRQERAAAREEFREDLVALQSASAAASSIASGAASALDWNLTVGTLTDAVIEQLRRSDTAPLLLLLSRAPRDAAGFVQAGAEDELDLLLDHVTCLTATFLTIERPDLTTRSVSALTRIYDSSFDAQGIAREHSGGIPSALLELKIITRVWALGALATRQREWATVRELAGHRPAVDQADYWTTWLFHGAVMAARASLLNDPQNRARGLSPLVLAQEIIQRLDCLRPDLDAAAEQVMTSLCQFDMLACFVAIDLGRDRRGASFFAQFARWYAQRSNPAAIAVIERPDVRLAIFPHDDTAVADALVKIADAAARLAGPLHGWDGFEDERIISFIQQHATQE